MLFLRHYNKMTTTKVSNKMSLTHSLAVFKKKYIYIEIVLIVGGKSI